MIMKNKEKILNEKILNKRLKKIIHLQQFKKKAYSIIYIGPVFICIYIFQD